MEENENRMEMGIRIDEMRTRRKSDDNKKIEWQR